MGTTSVIGGKNNKENRARTKRPEETGAKPIRGKAL